MPVVTEGTGNEGQTFGADRQHQSGETAPADSAGSRHGGRSPLFRPESLNQVGPRLQGDVIVRVPKRLAAASVGVGLAILGGLGVCLLVPYAHVLTVPGSITPEAGMIRVVADGPGVVDSLFVNEGQVIARGKPLASLRRPADGQYGDFEMASVGDLSDEVAARVGQASSAQQKLAKQAAELRARRDLLAAEMAEVERGVLLLERRRDLAERAVERTSMLVEQGYSSATRLDQLRDVILMIDLETSRNRVALTGYRRQIRDVEGELSLTALDQSAAVALVAEERAAGEQRVRAQAIRARRQATAPIDGRVTAVLVNPGQAVADGAVLAIIQPRGSRLVAEIQVPASAAGYVRPGQRVELTYDRLPTGSSRLGHGVVLGISGAPVSPAELGGGARPSGEPTFRARVLIVSSDRAGGRVLLRPGMALLARIPTGRKSLVQWIFDRALREPVA